MLRIFIMKAEVQVPEPLYADLTPLSGAFNVYWKLCLRSQHGKRRKRDRPVTASDHVQIIR